MPDYGDIGIAMQGAGGNNDLLSILKGLGFSQPTGLAGFLGGPVGGLVTSLGGDILGGLGSLIGGKSQAQKSARDVYNLAKNRLGQNVLDPNQYMASFQQSMAPRFNQQADSINRRLGLDSGVAQAELGSQMQAPLAGFYLDTKVKNDQLKAQFDNQLLSLMGDVSRYM
jgi:hypothetical protein